MKQQKKQVWKWWFKGLSATIFALIAIGGGYGFGAVFHYVADMKSQEAVDLTLRSSITGLTTIWVIALTMSIAIVWFAACSNERRLTISEWIIQTGLGSILITVALPTVLLSSMTMSELPTLSLLLDNLFWIGGLSLIAYVLTEWILPNRQLLAETFKRK